MQPFGRNRHGPKIVGGCAPLGEGELGPHLTQCGQGRGLPVCQVLSWSIQPFGHNTPTLQTDRRDRKRSDRIGRTDLQTVTQKPTLIFKNCACVRVIVHNCAQHSTARNSSDNFLSYSRDNRHCSASAYAYWGGGCVARKANVGLMSLTACVVLSHGLIEGDYHPACSPARVWRPIHIYRCK